MVVVKAKLRSSETRSMVLWFAQYADWVNCSILIINGQIVFELHCNNVLNHLTKKQKVADGMIVFSVPYGQDQSFYLLTLQLYEKLRVWSTGHKVPYKNPIFSVKL